MWLARVKQTGMKAVAAWLRCSILLCVLPALAGSARGEGEVPFVHDKAAPTVVPPEAGLKPAANTFYGATTPYQPFGVLI